MRPLLFVGPPGSGRSELAEVVARRVKCRVSAVDASGLEGAIASSVAGPNVLDLASEAWLDRSVRVSALDRCVVVAVQSPLGRDGASQASGAPSREAELWLHLTVPFRESHLVVSGSPESLSREGAVERVLEMWDREPVAVAVGERSYVVDIGHGIFESRVAQAIGKCSAVLLITDSNVDELYGGRAMSAISAAGTRSVRAVFQAGEAQKHLGTLQRLLEEAQRGGIDRSSRVLAFGGGVVTDVGGFVAATWMRGLNWISVPTTLLGMVDASVGGKTAVDLGEGKNAVGAFWQPSSVICDVEWLRSETQRNFSSALAEVVKTAMVGDPGLFTLLEDNVDPVLARDVGLMSEVVRRCVRVKARVVGLDEREQGLRAVLNLGHTIGHALESSAGFGARTHGECVSLGLVAACRLGVRWGVSPQDVLNRVEGLLGRLGLPKRLDKVELQQAADLVGLDKKRKASTVRFVFPKAIGDVCIETVPLEELGSAMPGLSDGS